MHFVLNKSVTVTCNVICIKSNRTNNKLGNILPAQILSQNRISKIHCKKI